MVLINIPAAITMPSELRLEAPAPVARAMGRVEVVVLHLVVRFADRPDQFVGSSRLPHWDEGCSHGADAQLPDP
jgi:hypothetical protein